MAAAPARPLSAMEVPIAEGEGIKWIELTVPFTSPPPLPDSAGATSPAMRQNAASCNVVSGDPPAYLFWRIHENLPNVLEIVEIFACKEYPETGLHLTFHDALHPYAFICKNEHAEEDEYFLYTVTVSGTAYLLNLKRPFNFLSGSNFPQSEVIEFSVQSNALDGKITSVAATFGCLLVGRQDGSISCYQLGILDPCELGFMHELRNDGGFGRLWNLMHRGKAAGAVRDMVISEVCTCKILFVLHSDGIVRSWDLVSRARVLNHSLCSSDLIGTTPSRLWVGSPNYDAKTITLAVLHVSDVEVITVYNFGINVGEKNILSPAPLSKSIVLEKGRFIDLKISSSKLWILKEDGSLFYELSDYDTKMVHASNYGLQEDFVADQLFQSSEHALDDLVWTNTSLFSVMKDRVAQFVSSIFLQRLLQPGIYHNAVLRAVLLERKKYFSEYEFQSISFAGLRKDIFTIVNAEADSVNSNLVVRQWKNFCSHYFRQWCQFNVPYGLFFDTSNNVLGLIRKNSFSLFRSLEGIEKLIYGSSDDFHDLKSYGLLLVDESVDNEVLYEVLRCTSHINNQIGRAASAVFYESLLVPSISSEDVVFHLLKILETGYCPLAAYSAQVGVDASCEKRQAAHRSLRNFSVDMLLSLHALHSRATNWAGVLNVIVKYLEFLKPHRSNRTLQTEGNCSVNFSLLVQATSQVARVMFETAFDVLLLLGYLINTSGQFSLMQADVTRVKASLIPMAHEILTQWLVLHFMGTTPTSSSAMDDFSSRLSSLHIGIKADKRPLNGKLGSPACTLAFLLDFPTISDGDVNIKYFLSSENLIQSVRKLSSLLVWGVAGEESSITSIPTVELASLLLRHGQYEAAENLLLIIDDYSTKRKMSPGADADLCRRLHLLGFCLIMQAHLEADGLPKKHKILEAVRCLFRAASLSEASQSLQNLSLETGFQYSGASECIALWKLHYYQWAMLMFDQYAMSEGACQFALAALEQADEILALNDGNVYDDFLSEPASTIRGRLWANVFKFSLDLKNYRDAYCSIISNPDEDSKYICLRRFVIVLCEHGATKVLCDGKLPFVGMIEKVEQELFWKAERSDIFAKPNLYKLLYSFHGYRNNWRKAASYIYQYSVRLKKEVNADDTVKFSTALQERLEGLCMAINALQLVDHASAWIDSKNEDGFSTDQDFRHKRARNALAEKSAGDDFQSERMQHNVDIKMLEKEYVLTSAQYLLAHNKDKIKFSGNQKLSHLVGMLIKENFNQMAFTVILTFWKGSTLNRELEQAFIALSEKCFSGGIDSPPFERVGKASNPLLPSPEDATHSDLIIKSSYMIDQIDRNGHWETLELNLEKYRKIHQRLPVVVAETLLFGDSQIELPFWLINMFKAGRRTNSWGMTGEQPDSATLFRLYVDYGRLSEATNLLLEYLESFASLNAVNAINRKKMSAIWFPYTAIERLWSQLEELCGAGHMVEQCGKLKRLLQGALLNHLNQIKVDSEDAVAASAPTTQAVRG